jgi:predicted  nucleic acid-binding Zn-ribbon protein
MSGRIRNPTDLMKLSQEVENLKAAVAAEEDAQLELMEEEERLRAEVVRLRDELAAAREREVAAAPDLRQRLEQLERDLAETEEEAVRTWSSIPPEWQEVYRQVQRRYPDPVAGVSEGHCQACRVAVTSSGMQILRRAGLHLCDGCGRVLVVR